MLGAFVRHLARLVLTLLLVGTPLVGRPLVATPLGAQIADSASRGDKTFLTKRDLGISALGLGAAALLSVWDDDIAKASQESRFKGSGLTTFANRASKVNETTLTAGGIIIW